MIHVISTRLFYNKIFFISIFLSLIILLNLFLFDEVFTAHELSFFFLDKTHTLPSNITSILKISYLISMSITWCFVLNNLYRNFMKTRSYDATHHHEPHQFSSHSLVIGKNSNDNSIISIPEKGLYQNMLITRNHWNGKNIFCYVSFYQAVNSNGLRHVDTRRQRKFSCKSKRNCKQLSKKCHYHRTRRKVYLQPIR